tara:strand:- start:165 stop:371 length:207 start_codon:yes stop_codon:yes gene_type:complete
MSIILTENSKDDSILVLSLEEYKVLVKEDSSARKEYSKVGHLYPEKNTPQYRWFKDSRYRGGRRDMAS